MARCPARRGIAQLPIKPLIAILVVSLQHGRRRRRWRAKSSEKRRSGRGFRSATQPSGDGKRSVLSPGEFCLPKPARSAGTKTRLTLGWTIARAVSASVRPSLIVDGGPSNGANKHPGATHEHSCHPLLHQISRGAHERRV